jgi:hypothetical protein
MSTQVFTPHIAKQSYKALSAKIAYYYLKAYQNYLMEHDLSDDSGEISMSALVRFMNNLPDEQFLYHMSLVMAHTHYKS